MRRVLFKIPLHINLSGIRIDGIPIFAYGAMLCLGFLAAIYITVWRTKRLGKNPEVIFNCALLAFAGGIIGSRGFYVLQHSHEFDNVWQMINIRGGGLTYFGGLLLATTFVIYYLRRKKENVLEWVDIITPSLALGLSFGRIGCFLNGCCWGGPSNVPWAFAWPEDTLPYNAAAAEWQLAHPVQDLPADWIMPTIHPAQIYSWLNALLLFVVLWFLFRSKRRHGQILGTFGALYSVSRFLIEVLRSDEAKAYLFGLPTLFRSFGRGDLVAYLPTMTISQNVSIVIFIISIIFLRTILRSHHRALVVKPTSQ